MSYTRIFTIDAHPLAELTAQLVDKDGSLSGGAIPFSSFNLLNSSAKVNNYAVEVTVPDDFTGALLINNSLNERTSSISINKDISTLLNSIKSKTDSIVDGRVTVLSSILQDDGVVNVFRYDTWNLNMSNLGNLSDKVVIFSLANSNPTDTKPYLLIRSDTGLEMIKGKVTTEEEKSLGSVTLLDETNGRIGIRVDESITSQLTTGRFMWSVKSSENDDIQTLAYGDFKIIKEISRVIV